MTTSSNLTSDERIFAALAHGSVMLSFFGPIGPIVIWLLSKVQLCVFSSFASNGISGFVFLVVDLGEHFIPCCVLDFSLIGNACF